METEVATHVLLTVPEAIGLGFVLGVAFSALLAIVVLMSVTISGINSLRMQSAQYATASWLASKPNRRVRVADLSSKPVVREPPEGPAL